MSYLALASRGSTACEYVIVIVPEEVIHRSFGFGLPDVNTVSEWVEDVHGSTTLLVSSTTAGLMGALLSASGSPKPKPSSSSSTTGLVVALELALELVLAGLLAVLLA
jgi:hypothetical protein